VQEKAQEVAEDFYNLGLPGSPEEFLSDKLGYTNYGCQKSLARFVDEYYWIDAGNVRSYLWANYDVLRGFVDSFSPPGKQKNGNWIGENVSIDETAEIISPVVIGDNVEISKNSSIGPFSVLHNDVKIKENVRVERSVIWENSILNSNSLVQNSVICDNVEIEEDRKIIKYSAIS